VKSDAQIAELVGRCRQGDDLAWEALVRQFQSRIFGLAFHFVRDREEARDLAQEIFVRIYRGLDSCRDDESFVPWALAMGRYCCIDRLRRLKSRPRPIYREETDLHEAEDGGPDPEEAHEANMRRRLIYRALDRLSSRNREMILLKDIQGLKLRDIAEMLGVPVGTVKSRTGRARVELAKAIVAIDPDYGVRP
jgi:RNA polymerase sigma-70 factor (ECF subfamily)